MLVCFYVAPTFNSYLICLASLFLCVSTELSYFYLYIYQHQYVVNFHQRYSTTSVSNTTKSFCVPWSWTNNLSCWNKSHRKNGGWLSTIPGFYSKTSSLNEMWKKKYFPLSFEGYLCHSGSSDAIFPDGRLLLDARWGNLPLPLCCESLQHQHQDAHVSCHFMGYFDSSVELIKHC